MSHFNAAEQDAIRRANRPMEQDGLISMVDVLDELYDGIETLTAGSTALGADIDSLALGGGAFTVNADLTTGLTLALQGGRVSLGTTVLSVAPTTIALATSATNYVEVDSAGALHANTAAFTAGRCPLYVVVTGTGAITSWTSAKALLSLASISSVIRSEQVQVFTLIASGGAQSFPIQSPGVTAKVAAAVLSVANAITQSDANYWTWSIVNLGPSGTGATAIDAATAASTTKATGGVSLGAGIGRSIALNATSANLNTAANDRLVLTLTPTGTPSPLIGGIVRIDFSLTA